MMQTYLNTKLFFFFSLLDQLSCGAADYCTAIAGAVLHFKIFQFNHWSNSISVLHVKGFTHILTLFPFFIFISCSVGGKKSWK